MRVFPLICVVFLITLRGTPALADDNPQTPPPKAQAQEKPPAKLTEKEKIDALLRFVEKSDVTFIRNGEPYSGKDAAAHMQRKLDHAGKRIKTATQFIEHLASKSSVSGQPYKVRFKDGREIESKEWLLAELKRVENPPAEESKTTAEKTNKDEKTRPEEPKKADPVPTVDKPNK